MSDEFVKAQAELRWEAHAECEHEAKQNFILGYCEGWDAAVARKVDPTQFVEHVSKTLYERERASGSNLPSWEETSAIDKQNLKQGIVGLLYDTLGALTDQGLIGGIDNRG